MNTRKIETHMALTEEKPNWEEIAKIHQPPDNKCAHAGCWNEGEMVGYAKAVLSFKKKLSERIAICDNVLNQTPEGWPAVKLLIEGVKNELTGLLNQY